MTILQQELWRVRGQIEKRHDRRVSLRRQFREARVHLLWCQAPVLRLCCDAAVCGLY